MAEPVRVLVAERSHVLRAQVADVLRQAGYEPLQAGNGNEALAQAPDAALLLLGTVWIPDGFEVLRLLRARPAGRRLPVIMLLPRDNAPAWDAARAAGASDVSPWPPASAAELLGLVAQLLSP